MSFSNNTERVNPATRFYQWDGTNGGFNYWDKTRGEKGERAHVGLPFSFIVLDVLSTIKGFSDEFQSGFWSNEVRSLKDEPFTVRTKKGVAGVGVYNDVKNINGAKYCQSVYIVDKQDGQYAIANVQLTGAAVSAWIEFRKGHRDIYAGAIRVASMVEGKKGSVKFQSPVFEMLPITAQGAATATALDKELQEYLNSYFKKPETDSPKAEHEDNVSYPTETQESPEETPQLQESYDDLPF